MPDLPGPELLNFLGERLIRVELARGEELHALCRGVRDEGDVLAWVHPHVGKQTHEEHVASGADFGHADRPPFEVADRADSIGGEQFEAADVAAAKNDDRIARVDLPDPVADEPQCYVDVTGGEGTIRAHAARHDVPNVGEAFSHQQILGDPLRRHADTGADCRWPIESDLRRLRRWLDGAR